MDRISIMELTQALVMKNGIRKTEAEMFVRAFFNVIEQGIMSEKTVKVKGLGTFKIVGVEARESVNVNTGERVVIKSHNKLSFSPDTIMKELVNKPFSQFETVTLDDNQVEPEVAAIVEATVPEAEEETEEFTIVPIAEEPINEPEQPIAEEEEQPIQEEEQPVQEEELPIQEVEQPIQEVEEQPTAETEEPETEEAIMPIMEEELPVQEEELPIVEEELPQEEEELPQNEEELPQDEEDMPQGETPEESAEEPKEDETAGQEQPQVPDSSTEKPDNNTENEDEGIWKTIGYTVLYFVILLATFVGGYYAGRINMLPTLSYMLTPQLESIYYAEDIPTSEPADTVEAKTDSVATVKEEKAETTEKKAETAEKKAEGTPDYKKYEAMDLRVKHGAYAIVGKENTVTVKAGETMKQVARRTLGPDMECYIEVFNGIKSGEPLREGQTINIPKIVLKKSLNKKQ